MTQVQSILESKLNLGAASLLGDGGQGKVYQTSIILSQPSISLVYKKYKGINQMGLNANVLKDMIAFLHNLDLKQTTELLSICSWPIGLVLDDRSNKPCGFLMPKISTNFYQLTTNTVAGTKSGNLSEFQYLLNDATIIRKRYSLMLADDDRYLLLHQVAESLNKLHNYGISVGDISPKNLLFCLSPSHAVFFLDADAMRFRLSSALIQCETPGWGVREAFNSEELGTPAADCYKLGLLALRLFAGSQVSSDPAQLPSNVSDRFKHIVSETIRNRDLNRPSISEWIKCLSNEANNAVQANLVPKYFPSKAYQPNPVPFSASLKSQSVQQRLLHVRDEVYSGLAQFLRQEPVLKLIGSLLLILLLVLITSREKRGSQPEAQQSIPQNQSREWDSDGNVPEYTPPAPADQEAAQSELRSLIGTWEGTYYCNGKPRRLELILAYPDDQKAAALFKFYPGSQALSDSSQKGSFLMDVSYAHSGLRGRGEIGELQLSAASWVSRPKGYDMVNMEGSVYLAEKRITGRVTEADCGDFELSYVGQQGVDELLSVIKNYQTSTVSQSASSEQPHQEENRRRPTLEICNNAPSNQLLVSVVVTISTNNALSNDRVWEANGWHTIQHLTCKSFLLPEHYAVSSQDVLLYAYNLNRREWADPSGPTICVRNLYGGNGSVWSMRWQGDEPKCPSTGYREAQAHRFGVGTNGGKWNFNTESIGEIPYELIQK